MTTTNTPETLNQSVKKTESANQEVNRLESFHRMKLDPLWTQYVANLIFTILFAAIVYLILTPWHSQLVTGFVIGAFTPSALSNLRKIWL